MGQTHSTVDVAADLLGDHAQVLAFAWMVVVLHVLDRIDYQATVRGHHRDQVFGLDGPEHARVPSRLASTEPDPTERVCGVGQRLGLVGQGRRGIRGFVESVPQRDGGGLLRGARAVLAGRVGQRGRGVERDRVGHEMAHHAREVLLHANVVPDGLIPGRAAECPLEPQRHQPRADDRVTLVNRQCHSAVPGSRRPCSTTGHGQAQPDDLALAGQAEHFL